jgi:hypothetical protein
MSTKSVVLAGFGCICCFVFGCQNADNNIKSEATLSIPQYGDAIELFNGKDMSLWQVKGTPQQSKWIIGKAGLSTAGPPKLINLESTETQKTGTPDTNSPREMINLVSSFGESIDIYTKKKFGDCRVELELMLPRGGNSGIYLMGEYEVQVTDSFGAKAINDTTIGSVFGAETMPAVNAARKPGEWQNFVIEFQAPRFNSRGSKTANAKFIKIELNGHVLSENLEVPITTIGGLTEKEAANGPLMIQGHYGPVSLRNIIIKPVLKK